MRRCCSSAGIVKAGVQRVGECVGGVRIHEQRFGHLARGAGERREDQHALSIVARGDEFLRHQIHAVVQRRYHAHVGRAIAGEDVFDAVVRARQDNRLPVVGAVPGVDVRRQASSTSSLRSLYSMISVRLGAPICRNTNRWRHTG